MLNYDNKKIIKLKNGCLFIKKYIYVALFSLTSIPLVTIVSCSTKKIEQKEIENPTPSIGGGGVLKPQSVSGNNSKTQTKSDNHQEPKKDNGKDNDEYKEDDQESKFPSQPQNGVSSANNSPTNDGTSSQPIVSHQGGKDFQPQPMISIDDEEPQPQPQPQLQEPNNEGFEMQKDEGDDSETEEGDAFVPRNNNFYEEAYEDASSMLKFTLNGKIIGRTSSFNMTKLVIPTFIKYKCLKIKIKSIGSGAFNGSSNSNFPKLTSVVIPNSITYIDDYAFFDNEIDDLTMGNSVQTIGEKAFHKNKLNCLFLPNSVKWIGDNAFSSNEISGLKIGNSVTTISQFAFRYNKIKSLNIPNSVMHMGDYSFSDNEIEYLTISNSLKEISNYAFSKNKIENLEIPDSVKTIADNAFSSNQISELKIGNSIETITREAFKNNKIQSLTIPDSVKTIGEYAFAQNELKSLKLGNNVNSIFAKAFLDHKLSTLNIPDSIMSTIQVDISSFDTNNVSKNVSKEDEVCKMIDKLIKNKEVSNSEM